MTLCEGKLLSKVVGLLVDLGLDGASVAATATVVGAKGYAGVTHLGFLSSMHLGVLRVPHPNPGRSRERWRGARWP